MKLDFDVVVVGSGVAGLAAAWTAASRGARVLVVECESQVGGSSRLSGSWIQAAGTSLQRAAGIVDSPDAMLADYLTINRWRVEPGLARAFCEGAAEVVEWLLELGLAFGPIVRAGSESVWRGHRAVGEGEALVQLLARRCATLGVEFAFGNRVDELVMIDGAVAGVQARGESLRAGAVVMASGGFARNPTMLGELVGGPWLAGSEPQTLAGPGSRGGDAITMATAIGASTHGLGRSLWVPQALTPPGVVLVRPDGRRFIDESAEFTTAAVAADEFGGIHYALFDESIRRSPRNTAIERTAAGHLFRDDDPQWDDPPLGAWLSAGDLVVGTSVSEVARGLGLDAPAVQGAVDKYNAACRSGVDDRFEKPAEFLTELASPPFYGIRIRPTVLIATFCGLRIDTNARVLDHLEQPIPGLYAAGEAAGGVVGDVYAGHGNSITGGLVFGRIAGEHAAQLAAT